MAASEDEFETLELKARDVKPGDRLIAYSTRIGRWDNTNYTITKNNPEIKGYPPGQDNYEYYICNADYPGAFRVIRKKPDPLANALGTLMSTGYSEYTLPDGSGVTFQRSIVGGRTIITVEITPC